MITNIDKAIRAMFGIYFQRSFDPDLHENCPGCKRELSTEEMEKDLKYQEKLAVFMTGIVPEEPIANPRKLLERIAQEGQKPRELIASR